MNYLPVLVIVFTGVAYQDAKVFFESGVKKYERGDFSGAIVDFTKAIEASDKFAAPYYNRGMAKEAKGEYDGAVADYTAAIERDAKYSDAYNNRGRARMVKGEIDEAIADFTRSLELTPTSALAWNNRAALRTNKGELDGAISDASKAIEIAPKFASAYFNRGIARYCQGAWKEALADFEQSKESDSVTLTNRLCTLRIWMSHTRNKDSVAARKAILNLRFELQREPESWEGKVIGLFTRHLEEAEFLELARGQKSKGRLGQSHLYVATVRLSEGDAAGAKDHLTKSLEPSPLT